MIWILIRKELLTNLLTLRLGIAVIFTVVLAVLTTLIGSLDYSRNIAAYEEKLREAKEELNQATVYAQVRPEVIVPPLPMSVLCRGTMGTTGQHITVRVDKIYEWSRGPGVEHDSSLMNSLVQIDFATVVALLLSFLAVVLGFDGVCGERERGTLKQLLANSLPRGSVVLAKLLGGLLSVWIPFGLAFIISLLIIQSNPDIDLSPDDWLRLTMLFALGCLFLGQVFSLSLMVSTFTRDSDTSLIICLFAWLVGGVAYVNALPSFSRYGVPETPFQVFRDQRQKLYDNYDEEMQQWQERNPSPGEAYLEGIWNNRRLRYAHPRGYAWMQQRNEIAMDKQLDIATRKNKLRRAHQRHLAREAHIVDDGAIFSPITNFQTLSYQLAQTTLDDMFFFASSVKDYRETLISYLRGKQAFSSRRWFSDDPEDQEPLIHEPEEATDAMLAADSKFMRARMAWAQEQEKLVDGDQRRLDLTDMPKFGGQWKRSLAGTIEVMTQGLAALILSFGASVLVTFLRFLRYDPR